MAKKQSMICVLLGIALLLCVSGCSHAYDPVQPSTAAPHTDPSASEPLQETLPADTSRPDPVPEYTSAPETTAASEYEQTKPAETDPVETRPTETNPVETEPTMTEPVETEPVETQPEQTETIQAQPVIDGTVAALAVSMPALTYDSSWSGGTVVELPVAPDQSVDGMVNALVAYLLDLFTYEQDAQTAAYTYSLAYQGISEDRSNHIFTVSYTADTQVPEGASFDSNAVVAQTTQGVLNSAKVKVTAFDGSAHKECIAIRDVPYFYGTEEAVQCLIGVIETEIYTQNLLGADYREFCLVFDSEEDTCYVFLLYLK